MSFSSPSTNSPDSLNMSCSGVKMFLVPRSSILADWAGASLSPAVCSGAFSARPGDTAEEVEEVVTLLTTWERRERDRVEVIITALS